MLVKYLQQKNKWFNLQILNFLLLQFSFFHRGWRDRSWTWRRGFIFSIQSQWNQRLILPAILYELCDNFIHLRVCSFLFSVSSVQVYLYIIKTKLIPKFTFKNQASTKTIHSMSINNHHTTNNTTFTITLLYYRFQLHVVIR
jgi:hypothetical protein